MARPQAFVREEVLDAAIRCFWLHGFEATSIRDLIAEMGIHGPSLYNAFGDKRGLFIEALQRYSACTMRERIARLEELASPVAAIHAFFQEVIEKSLADPENRGCMIVNAALDVGAHDREIRMIVSDLLGEIEGFFRSAVAAANGTEQGPWHLDPEDMGRMLLGIVIGIRVLARTGAKRDALEGTVRPALALLCPFPSKERWIP
jgi:TetR/AcrR family transcriptional regulator, transcriptional repressor for nem operon